MSEESLSSNHTALTEKSGLEMEAHTHLDIVQQL